MTLEQKKAHILRCVELGMDFYKCCICAACTEAEVDLLSKDEKFKKEVKEKYILEEYNLLLKHNAALEIAKMKGNAKPIEWRLGLLDPKKYGNKIDIGLKGAMSVASFDIELTDDEEKEYRKRINDMFGENFIN